MRKPHLGWRLLARPGLHVVFGLVFLIVFAWPFVAFKRPAATWIFLHASWLGAVGLLALCGLADGRAPPDEIEDEVDLG